MENKKVKLSKLKEVVMNAATPISCEVPIGEEVFQVLLDLGYIDLSNIDLEENKEN